MTDYLAVGLFLCVIAIVYLLLVSDRGIPMHRCRDWEARHDRMERDLRGLSDAGNNRSRTGSDHPVERKVDRDRR